MTGTAYFPVSAGSPGPFERKTPSGRIARIESAGVCAGTTVTAQPDRCGRLRAFAIRPHLPSASTGSATAERRLVGDGDLGEIATFLAGGLRGIFGAIMHGAG